MDEQTITQHFTHLHLAFWSLPLIPKNSEDQRSSQKVNFLFYCLPLGSLGDIIKPLRKKQQWPDILTHWWDHEDNMMALMILMLIFELSSTYEIVSPKLLIQYFWQNEHVLFYIKISIRSHMGPEDPSNRKKYPSFFLKPNFR